MPTPKSGESMKDFMDRCMPMVMDEGKSSDQAVAMCTSMFKQGPMNMRTKKPLIAMSAPVMITAAATEGEAKGPAKFSATFYTDGAMDIAGWDLPVVVDLAGLQRGKVLVANQYHNDERPVGNFDISNDGKTLVAHGTAIAATETASQIVQSAINGYLWQASLEVNPQKTETVQKGKLVTVNGQEFSGPLYVTRRGVLKGFAFVSHGADDNTTVSIAANASAKEKQMKPEITAWAESMGIDCDNLTPELTATIEANYEGQHSPKAVKAAPKSSFETRKIEAKRRNEIRIIADRYIDQRDSDEEEIGEIEKMHDEAIVEKMTAQEFKLKLYESGIPAGRPVIYTTKNRGLTNRVLEAAICKAGSLNRATLEKHFTDQELQTAHDYFKDGIGLNQVFIVAAQSRGYQGMGGGKVNAEVLRAAFQPMNNRIYAEGFSTLSIADVIAATANKFLHEGWMSVDQTALALSATRNVRNFQTTTTVSLTGALMFEKLGAAGEIKHGTLGDVTYTNKADTYAQMLAITRQDQINDDLGALTSAPRRLGRGGMLMLNDIWWTKFLGLVNASFFASGNNNINTGVADMTVGGLDATETIFMNQTDPDGKPLGVMANHLVVPTALKNKAITLMTSELAAAGATTYTTAPGAGNPFRGRFTVHSSPYVSNSSYTGYTSTGYWMLANPGEIAVMEIAALDGRIEPIVDTAQADFDTLGIQMRGYADVGVNSQEFRGGVYADGGSS